MTCGPRVTCIRWPCKTGRACGSSAQVRLPSVHITDIGLKENITFAVCLRPLLAATLYPPSVKTELISFPTDRTRSQ